jgi:mRNA interferase MazF
VGIKQYDIILVELNPTKGSEIYKTRPCVVLSPNEMNAHLRTVIVGPMTTKLKPIPSRVKVNHDGKQGMIALDQIRTIDKRRIKKNLGSLSNREVNACKETLMEILVL